MSKGSILKSHFLVGALKILLCIWPINDDHSRDDLHLRRHLRRTSTPLSQSAFASRGDSPLVTSLLISSAIALARFLPAVHFGFCFLRANCSARRCLQAPKCILHSGDAANLFSHAYHFERINRSEREGHAPAFPLGSVQRRERRGAQIVCVLFPATTSVSVYENKYFE